MDQAIEDEFVQDERQSLSQLQETILFGVARYWMLILIFVGVGLGLGIYVGASQPNTYLSEAKLLLRFGEREGLTAESLTGARISNDSEPTMEDEIHLLNDRAVFRGVVEQLGVDAIMAPDDPKRYDDENTPIHVKLMHGLQAYLLDTSSNTEELSELSPEEQILHATESLQKHTVVMNDGDSNVIQVLHFSTSPERTQRVLQELVNAFIQRHREQFSVKDLLPKYQEEVQAAESEYDVAASKLEEHRLSTGIINLEQERNIAIDRKNTIEEEMGVARRSLVALQAERNQVDQDMAKGNDGFDNVDQKEAIQTRDAELRTEIPSALSTVEALGTDLESLNAFLKDLAAAGPARRELLADADRLKGRYEAQSEALARVETLAAIDVEGDTNLKIMQGASLPLDKEGPKRLKLIILGLAAGAGIGTSIAVLRQAFEGSLRYPTTVQRTSGVQLLAVVPESTDVRRLQRVRQVI